MVSRRSISLFDISDAMNTKAYTYDEFLLALVPLFHALLFFDEEEQVNGIIFLADYGGAKMGHLTWVGLDNMKRLAEFTTVRTKIDRGA